MSKEKYLSLPIEDFSMKEVENDDRLCKVSLKLMHDGINANGSEIKLKDLKRDFKKYVSNSIAGIPIVAGFKRNKKGEDDFSAHDDDEQILGSVFADSCNAKFVYDENYKRTFIEVEGYIYRYYSNGAVDILENAKDNKRACSVELEVLDGSMDKDRGIYQIKEWKLLAVTLLSSDVKEGMKGSQCELTFTDKSIDILKQLNDDINKAFSKQGNKIDGDKKPLKTNKKGVEVMFNKKEFAEKLGFGLSAMQLANEFAKACYSVKYDYIYSDGETCKYTKYWFEDYTDEYVYAYDSECGYPVGIKYEFEGDLPKLDFENVTRMKATYMPFDNGSNEEDDDKHDFKEYSIESLEIARETACRELAVANTKITEFESAPVVEDKTIEVEKLQGEVDKFAVDLESAKQVAIDLGLKFDEITEEKKTVDNELISAKETIANYEASEKIAKVEGFKEKSKESFNKVADKFSKEEVDELGTLIEEIDSEEKFNAFEIKIKDLAFARFTAISSGKSSVSKFGRLNVGNEIDDEPIPTKSFTSVFDKWQHEKESENK